MLSLIAETLVIAGAMLLTGALIPLRGLIGQLPGGPVRSRWYLLAALIVAFIAGYLGYATAFWGRWAAWLDLIVPAVFFFGAVFVWLTVTLARQTAQDIRRVLLLEHENITDPLLGIHNRRYLERRLGEEFARARRYGLPLSLLMLDIDHFKRINDTLGHQAGDRVLAHVAGLLAHAVREADVVARYGGEELVVIAPNTAAAPAAALAERLRRQVQTQPLAVPGEAGPPTPVAVTVSVGVADLGPEVTSVRGLIQNADAAVYHAKQAGRNRVCVFPVDGIRQAPAG